MENLPDKLRDAATHALMSAARPIVREAADEIERLRLTAANMSWEWIPVDERLPQEGVRCIIATRVPCRYLIDGEPKDGHEIEFGEWTGDRWKCFSIPCVSIMHPSMVSHWMPPPAPPTHALMSAARPIVREAAEEIERLRLTDAEREAVRFCVTSSLPETETLGGAAGELCRMHAARLRGLLERLK